MPLCRARLSAKRFIAGVGGNIPGDCLQDARTTVDPRQKTFLVEMAQAWQRLAQRETHARNGYACSVSELDRGD
jgi:hypothetical protein